MPLQAILQSYILIPGGVETIVRLSYDGIPDELRTVVFKSGEQLTPQTAATEILRQASIIETAIGAADQLVALVGQDVLPLSAGGPVEGVTTTLLSVIYSFRLMSARVRYTIADSGVIERDVVISFDSGIPSPQDFADAIRTEASKLQGLYSHLSGLASLLGQDILAWARSLQS